MKTFKIQKILIPVDFSETSLLALEHGSFMAKKFGGELLLVHVITQKYLQHNVLLPETEVQNIDQIIGVAQTKMQKLSEDVKEKYGIEPFVYVVVGKIPKEVIDLAKRESVDLIVMGTHGVSGFEEFFIGSNTARVVMESECPVLSVQTHATKIGFQKIVLPIDNTPASRQKIENALVIAERYQSEILVVGLLTDDDEEICKKFELKIEQVKSYIKSHQIICNIKILQGNNIAQLTMNYAQEIKADLIIIMTEQELDSTHPFMGPAAQQIVNHSKIPVMSVHSSALKLVHFHNNPV